VGEIMEGANAGSISLHSLHRDDKSSSSSNDYLNSSPRMPMVVDKTQKQRQMLQT
jgi:hypothetical protein